MIRKWFRVIVANMTLVEQQKGRVACKKSLLRLDLKDYPLDAYFEAAGLIGSHLLKTGWLNRNWKW